jgi:aryl-alcohol dehydrogenase-like predicted oxidoreductase
MDTLQSSNRSTGHAVLQISPLGLGTWAWGDTMVWSYGTEYSEDDIRDAFKMSVNAGVTFIDTAEVYGWGTSEKFIGRFIKETGDESVIATKFMPYPWRITKNSLRRALKSSLRRLQISRVDLYQIHWPFPPVPVRVWMDAMADVVEDGLVRAVGVSNYSKNQMLRAYDQLAKRNIPLATNQVEYSLLVREPEKSGLLDTCKRLGVTLIAYSPLAMGMLTGKYSFSNRPSGLRNRRYGRKKLIKIEKIVGLLREIGEERGGKSPAQVALNWTICKGTVPIPGAKNAKQAEQNAGALGWRLTEHEIEKLDHISKN